MDSFLRVLIVLFSFLTIPYLILLIRGLIIDGKYEKDKQTHYLLLILFFVMLIACLMSLSISTIGLLGEYRLIDGSGYINQASRVRTLILSFSNFALSIYFYKLFSNGRR